VSLFSKPYNPVGDTDSTPPSQRGFFSSILNNKYSDAMTAYTAEQKKAGKSSASIDWAALSKDDLKNAYRRKYKRPFPG
jgi:hypothetical protein